ncbi:MAG: hypothetical protein Q8M24_04765 [Pseudolabrys sp.]|nr:hypothetical protein [Pseudolabrys sp.]
MSSKPRPDFKAYTVVKREGQRDVWIDLGCAFLHGDGAGINVLLQATPIDGRIVLRPFVNEGRKDAGTQAQVA